MLSSLGPEKPRTVSHLMIMSAIVSCTVTTRIPRTDDEVTLQSNTIDVDAACLELFDNVQRRSGFGAWVLDVVIVVVELDLQTLFLDRLRCGSKRHYQ